ncbi:CLUMA_CG002860, isoform A [Clunio marinus]|uniref:CLUMA_CG002860, isoform A n=1 Tax=Clunio marinus TaxID=568069 RepID=A0A1J1HL79_9DIPT|nr:CLUMA_CG002860, isoform A [Clunio marinus]
MEYKIPSWVFMKLIFNSTLYIRNCINYEFDKVGNDWVMLKGFFQKQNDICVNILFKLNEDLKSPSIICRK